MRCEGNNVTSRTVRWDSTVYISESQGFGDLMPISHSYSPCFSMSPVSPGKKSRHGMALGVMCAVAVWFSGGRRISPQDVYYSQGDREVTCELAPLWAFEWILAIGWQRAWPGISDERE